MKKWQYYVDLDIPLCATRSGREYNNLLSLLKEMHFKERTGTPSLLVEPKIFDLGL